ncbi:F-box protein CPR1-like isoform X1 [Silene latifolia]|uniref:F-box protein CPR1-like isoform X1 n=1 Tax=Silene latifolia TaxID=37657 RepID=UPI003D76AA70
MAASLPLELITEIFTKLPVKSLHRFKCVSKTWNSIITSTKFIKQHLRQTLILNTNFNNIIISSNNSIFSSAISAVKLRFDIINHPLNNLFHRPAVDIIESVHGLLLIADYPKQTLYLFNPSNKTQRFVPPAPSGPSRKPGFGFGLVDVFGFGYDSVTDDYKVVRLVQWFDSGLCRETSVYSMRNDSWESVNDKTVPYSLQQTNAVAAQEKLCFVVSSRDSKPVLKCFDLRTSTFSLVNHPELDSYDFGKMTMSLRNLRGCLCLLMNYQEHKVDPAKAMGDPLYNRQFLYADVWELNESKWVKLFRIRKNEIHKDCMYLRLVTYSKDMKSVLVEVDGIWFGWYDLVSNRIERVPVQGLRVEDSPYLASTYVESLVSVENNKVVSKKEGTRPKKTIEKNDFLSSGFKLKL